MACQPAIMDEEARLMRSLEAVRAFSCYGIALDLAGADGATVLRLRQTDWD